MKPLSKKAKMAVGWTILMTVVGTAMLNQWQFFAMGLASIVLLIVANQYDLLKDPEDKNWGFTANNEALKNHLKVLKRWVIGVTRCSTAIEGTAIIRIQRGVCFKALSQIWIGNIETSKSDRISQSLL